MLNRRTVLGMSAAAIAGTAHLGRVRAQSFVANKLKLDAYSRTMHWLRKPEEVAQLCHEIGNTTIDLTVRAYPGHVVPDRVKTDLPPFVKRLRENGINVTVMASDIVSANAPDAEAILDTASSLGVHHHWWRGMMVDPSLMYRQQIESLKPRVAAWARLNERYGMKGMYHPTGSFGSGFADIMELVRNFDPRYISIQYDTGNFQQINQQILAQHLRIAGPYLGGIAFKDFVFEKNAPGAGTNPAGGGWPKNGWAWRQVPVGTGVLDLPLIVQTLKQVGFDGPVECQPEWPELGGANTGGEKITISREEFIALLKRDYNTVTSAFAGAGLM